VKYLHRRITVTFPDEGGGGGGGGCSSSGGGSGGGGGHKPLLGGGGGGGGFWSQWSVEELLAIADNMVIFKKKNMF